MKGTNEMENNLDDYARNKLPEINRENAQEANEEIKAQRTKYKNNLGEVERFRLYRVWE